MNAHDVAKFQMNRLVALGLDKPVVLMAVKAHFKSMADAFVAKRRFDRRKAEYLASQEVAYHLADVASLIESFDADRRKAHCHAVNCRYADQRPLFVSSLGW